jgi:hypothetical protein
VINTTIRLTDPSGKPIEVPPDLIASVRQADLLLKDRPESGLDYTGEWSFPARDQAELSLEVRIPSDTVRSASTFPYSTLANDWDRYWAVSHAFNRLLDAAHNVLRKRISAQLHDLIATVPED